jgi:hypothetical protein
MNHRRLLETVSRDVSSPSRRLSLFGLGGLALAAATGSAPARAGKASKKVKKTCRRQIGACESTVQAFCNGPTVEEDEREACLTLFPPCCALFDGCDAAAAYACLMDVFLNPPQDEDR